MISLRDGIGRVSRRDGEVDRGLTAAVRENPHDAGVVSDRDVGTAVAVEVVGSYLREMGAP